MLFSDVQFFFPCKRINVKKTSIQWCEGGMCRVSASIWIRGRPRQNWNQSRVGWHFDWRTAQSSCARNPPPLDQLPIVYRRGESQGCWQVEGSWATVPSPFGWLVPKWSLRINLKLRWCGSKLFWSKYSEKKLKFK